ncbi:MAG: hypothetical protein ABIU29_07365 [Chthoniobacterales bacterium]
MEGDGTARLFPEANVSSGTYVGYGTEYDAVPDREDTGLDVFAFANCMRSTKAPDRGEITLTRSAASSIQPR